MSRVSSVVVLLAGLALTAYPATPPAHADGGLTRAEILRQHRELARERGEGGGAAPVGEGAQQTPASHASEEEGSGDDNGNLVAQLLDRVSALETHVRQMQGQIDQLTNQVEQNQATTTKQLGDMQFALQNSGGGHAAAPVAAAAASAGAVAAGAAVSEKEMPRTAAQFLKSGHASLKARRYPAALADGQQALKLAHAASERVEAQYLVGQAYAGQKDYRQSAVAYYDAYSKAPKSAHAPEALLGVAASMLALGNKGAACQALDKLGKEFPAPSARVKASEKLFRTRGACR